MIIPESQTEIGYYLRDTLIHKYLCILCKTQLIIVVKGNYYGVSFWQLSLIYGPVYLASTKYGFLTYIEVDLSKELIRRLFTEIG